MKNILKFMSFLFIAFVFFMGCNKENEDKQDYRTKYSGSYDFITVKKIFNMLDSSYVSDTVSYFGQIYYSDTLESNKMVIHYLTDKSVIVIVDEQGIISSDGNNLNGEFKSENEVYFYYSWGGHGGGGSHEVNGFKNSINN